MSVQGVEFLIRWVVPRRLIYAHVGSTLLLIVVKTYRIIRSKARLLVEGPVLGIGICGTRHWAFSFHDGDLGDFLNVTVQIDRVINALLSLRVLRSIQGAQTLGWHRSCVSLDHSIASAALEGMPQIDLLLTRVVVGEHGWLRRLLVSPATVWNARHWRTHVDPHVVHTTTHVYAHVRHCITTLLSRNVYQWWWLFIQLLWH